MKKQYFIFLVILSNLIISCNKGSDSSNAKALTDEEILKKGVPVSFENRLLPNKYEDIQTASSKDEYEIRSSYYKQNDGIGCKIDKDGNFTNDYNNNPKVVEKSLKVGDIFTDQYLTSDITKAWDSSTSYAVSNISSKQINFNVMLNFSNDLFNGNNLDMDKLFQTRPHGTSVYDIETQKEDTKYTFSSYGESLVQQLKSKNKDLNKYWSCWIPESKDYSSSTKLISYELNGKKVSALLNEYSSKGKMKCDERYYDSSKEKSETLKSFEFENGETYHKRINSRMVKSRKLVPCEGEELFSTSTYKIDGKIIELYATKANEIPTR